MRIRAEQVAVLYRFPARLLGNIFNSGLVVAVVWGLVPVALLLTWFGLFVVVTAVRIWLSRVFNRRRPPPADMKRWARLFFLGAALTGGLWGAGSAIVWLLTDVAYHVFFAFVIAGTSAASTVMSMPHLASARAFLLLSVGPLAGGLLAVGSAMHLAMGAMCVLYILLLFRQAKVLNGVFMDSLRLRERNRTLVADLTAARDLLEDRVRERTDDLVRANAALEAEVEAHRQTGERLNRAQRLEAIGRLTGGIAHDFNNLLAVVLGNAEILLRRDNAKPHERQLQTIMRAGRRGAELTERLLAFSRRQALKPEPVDINKLVASLSELLDRTLGDSIKVTIRPGADPSYAYVDPGQLENAILNLALNARDAMNGDGDLIIETSNVRLEGGGLADGSETAGPSSGDFVLLTVGDTGVGIAPQDIDKVYDPFFTTKGVGEGQGLGLSMVHGFVNQSGGQIDIVSRPGEGTTVKLYLPRSEVAAAEDASRLEESSPRGSGRILVVEDDQEVRTVVTSFLDSLGYEVTPCDSSAAALALLEANPLPDLILADVVLPNGLSGPAMMTEIRDRHGPVRALFMTGYAAAAFEENDGMYDAARVLHKPFELAELGRKVRSIIESDPDTPTA